MNTLKIILLIIISLLIISSCFANTNSIKANCISDLKSTTENLSHIIAGKIINNKFINLFIGGNIIGDLIHSNFNSKNIQAPLIADTPSSVEVKIKSKIIKE